MRKATLQRTTKETDIFLRLNLDGRGKANISTGIRFFDHMLEQIARHGGLDLELRAEGDLDVDQHHTVEDVGIALGEAVKQALGSKRGILRSGYFLMPMDDCLAAAALDFSGRAYCVCNCEIFCAQGRRLPDRAARRFLPRLRPIGRRERAPETHLRPLVASSGRVHLQSIRQSAALRRLARQAPAQRPPIHQGAPVKIAIVDYGAGNLPSVERALQKLGAETERAVRPEQIADAEAVVLPGVGHFSAFVAGLHERNLTASLRMAHDAGVPILGICLGLQAMYESSEEAPGDPVSAFSPEKFACCPKT